MRPEHKRIIKITTGIAAASAAIFGAKKGFDFAAAPSAPKPCDYVSPESRVADTSAGPALPAQAPSFMRLGGSVVDASCLNRTAVFGVAHVSNEEQVAEALAFARENNLKITSAGSQHSMGGQSFSRGGIVLDMKGLHGMELNRETRVLRVQSGATWEQVQQFLDPKGLSVKAMQSINIFTIGGTLSVNAHGLAHDPGQVAPTVRSLRIMRADGSVVIASRTENAELFRHALGGYGLFGVILEAELDVVPNEVYKWERHAMPHTDVAAFYAEHGAGKPDVGLLYGRLAMNDADYLKAATMHVFTRVAHEGDVPPMQPRGGDWLGRFVINFSKTGPLGRWVRTKLERDLVPRVFPCVSRNQAISNDYVCETTRNQMMFDSMGYLKNRLPDTDILQEYFLPADNAAAFIDGLREVVRANDANLLNVTIRIVHKDETTALPYAKGDRLAFVLYFNSKFTDADAAKLRTVTTQFIDLSLKHGGTFYLPYQLVYSDEQLRAAYPEVDEFFAAKRAADPRELFVNEWYLKYAARHYAQR